MNISSVGSKASRYYRLALVRELLPDSRTASCMRIIARGKEAVEVLHNPERRSARFGNLCACGSGWICPLCAVRLAEKKADIIRHGLLNNPNIFPVLITLTMRHDAGMRLKNTIEQLHDSYRAMQQSRAFRDLTGELGWLSSITATEVTHGRNGWHPHYHVLALCDRNYDSDTVSEIEYRLFKLWIAQLSARNADCDREHGVNATSAQYSIADYISKFGREPADDRARENWGIESEIARNHYKVARARESRSPQGILLDSQGKIDSPDGRLFAEYYSATRGRKILTVSAKAKALLNLDREIDDDQVIIESIETVERVIAQLSRTQWQNLLHPVDRRELLIALASQGESQDLTDFVDSLA